MVTDSSRNEIHRTVGYGGADEHEAGPRRVLLPDGRFVRRARDWHLYDQYGDRYLDFWQSDGAAFLGHKPKGLSRLLKEEIDRGLWTPLPTVWPHRLKKALRALADEIGCAADKLRVVNGSAAAHRFETNRWFPLSDYRRSGGTSDESIDVVVPAPGAVLPQGGAIEELPAFTIAMLHNATWALIGYLHGNEATERLVTARELPVPPAYERHGCWLIPNGTHTTVETWSEVRKRALSHRIVVPPDRFTPAVVPGIVTSAERSQWEELCHDWPE